MINYLRIEAEQADNLWQLQMAYKREIGEELPTEDDLERLCSSIRNGAIDFYGAWDGINLIGCCSITKGFSTFNYCTSGVFEVFFIVPEYRHGGIARGLVRFAYDESGVQSLTVGCADCDLKMYEALGFTVRLGNLLAFE